MTKHPPPDVIRDFEAWATIAARLLQRSPDEQLEILRALDLVDVFPRANEAWSAVLRADVARRETARVTRYGQLCAEEVRRRAAAPSGAPPVDRAPNLEAFQDTEPFDDRTPLRPALPFTPPGAR